MYYLLILIFIPLSSYSQDCSSVLPSTPLDSLKLFSEGSECNPLHESTWEKGWKTPCDCINKKDVLTKMKAKDSQAEYGALLSKINSSMELRVSESIKNQLYTQVEQSLRLDLYLKKGIVSTSQFSNGNTEGAVKLPSNCRITKVNDLINEIKEKSQNKKLSCNQSILDKRLKLLFGKDGFEGWYNSKYNSLENTISNKLDENDKKNGLCIPYKSYLSLSNNNHLRKTYLKIIKAFKNDHAAFQKWAKNRENPYDTKDVIANYVINNKKLQEPPRIKGMGLVSSGAINIDPLLKKEEADSLKNDLYSGVDAIDKDDINQLIKTDPVFERLVRDDEFFNEITKRDDKNISENDPEIIKLITNSQDKSCKDLYGSGVKDEEVATTAPVSGKGRQSKSNNSESKQNLMTQFLCKEDFPKEFIDASFIENELSEKTQKKLKLDSKPLAELVITDYLYCSNSKPENNNLNNNLSGSGFASVLPKNSSLTNLLNPILNPTSDLRSQGAVGRDSMYKEFNRSTCPYLPEICKTEPIPKEKCNVSVFSSKATEGLLMSKNISNDPKLNEELYVLHKLSLAPQFTDKQYRQRLEGLKLYSDDEIRTLLILRQQSAIIQNARMQEDVLNSLTKSSDPEVAKLAKEGNKKLIYNKTLVNNDPSISPALKEKYNTLFKSIQNDNFLAEDSASESSSYFANYLLLGDKKDEDLITGIKPSSDNTKNDGIAKTDNTGDLKTGAPNSNGSIPAEVTDASTIPGQNNQDQSNSYYKRKPFKSNSRVLIPADPADQVEPPVLSDAPKPNDPPKLPGDQKEPPRDVPGTQPLVDTKLDSPTKTPIVIPTLTTKEPKGETVTFVSTYSTQKNLKKNDEEKSINKIGYSEDKKVKELEKQINSLDSLASEMERARNEKLNDNGNSEVQDLQNELAREKTRASHNQKIANIQNAVRNSINDRSIASTSAPATSFTNVDNKNYANEYDPMDRINTGKRVVNEKPVSAVAPVEAKDVADTESAATSSQGSAGAAASGAGANAGAGASLASASAGASAGSSGAPGKRITGNRYPSMANGERDPDDVCGYEKDLDCLFEHQSTQYSTVFVDNISDFIQALNLYGKSFRTLEVYKYKNEKQPRKYFVRYYEPNINLSEKEKIDIFRQAQELMKDFSRNRKKLKELSKLYVEVKKIEISKVDAQEISKKVLRLDDIKLLSQRRTRGL